MEKQKNYADISLVVPNRFLCTILSKKLHALNLENIIVLFKNEVVWTNYYKIVIFLFRYEKN
jgi:hypothetical protein